MDEQLSEDPALPPVPLWLELWGWYGIAAIVGAYALNTQGVLDEQSWTFVLLNLSGSSGVGLVCLRRRAWQGFWLEAVWAAISLAALVRLVV